MVPARRATIAFGVASALLVASFVFAQVVRIVEPLGLDQGLFACFARWVPRGALPYRDLFDSKPPLLLYLYGLAAAIPGDPVRALWMLEAVWLAATLAVGFAFARRLANSRWAGLATAALLFVSSWSPSWGGYWSRIQAEELLALPMLGAAWLAWRAMERPRLALLTGVLTGVCGLMKVPSMAIAAAWALAWLVPAAGATTPSRAHWTSASRRIGLLVAGIAVPWLLSLAWFSAHGALRDFVQAVFVYPRHYAAIIAPPWTDVLRDFGKTEVGKGSLLLAAGLFGLITLRRARAREFWLVLPWIALTLSAVVAQRQLAGYHYLLAVPALAVAGGFGLVAMARSAFDAKDALRPTMAIATALVVALAVREAWTWRDAYALDLERLRGAITRDDYLLRMQQGSYSIATEAHAAEYVRDHTGPGDTLLVWGMSPGIYPLADRRPVTRFPFHKVLLTVAPLSIAWPGLEARRAQLMTAMRATPPTYILVGRGDPNGFDPTDSVTSLVQFAELNDLVSREYHVETLIGRFVVLRRGPPAPVPAAQ